MWFIVPKTARSTLEPWFVAFTVMIAPFADVRYLTMMARGASGRTVPEIVSLELAGSTRSRTVLSSYHEMGVTDHAVIAVWADFLFITGYSLSIGLACRLSAELILPSR